MRIKLARPGLVGDLLGGPVRAFTIGVLVLAGLVLLAACANLASVLAARGADRQRELAVRISIGASRGRIVRQLLTETLLLAFVGGAAGLRARVRRPRARSPAWHAPIDVPIQFDIPVDLRVLLFAVDRIGRGRTAVRRSRPRGRRRGPIQTARSRRATARRRRAAAGRCATCSSRCRWRSASSSCRRARCRCAGCSRH